MIDRLLADLIRFDTRNPDGNEVPLAEFLGRSLERFQPDSIDLVDVGRHVYVLARFGEPKLLVNAHLDTVPANRGWTRPPHEPHVENGRLYGLGASDTKGAIAAILGALEVERPRDTAILFSGDEEHGGSCMRAFLATRPTIAHAIICEPTELKIGTRHRGVMAFSAEVSGQGGHSSRADHMYRPLAELARLAVRLDDWGRQMLTVGPPGFSGMCLNLAELRGGVAFNVVPSRAELLWSLRPPPGVALAEVKAAMAERIPAGMRWQATLENPSFATHDLESFRRFLGGRVDAPVDLGFWTEAAMLAAAGINAVVFGPGEIAQAHAPDESVRLSDLEGARDAFVEAFRGTH